MSLPPYLSNLIELYVDTRRKLKVEIDAVPYTLREKQPIDGYWSVSEVCAHLSLVQTSVSRILEKLIKKANKETLNLQGTANWDTNLPSLPEKVSAPVKTFPEKEISFDTAWTELELIHANILHHIPELAPFDLGKLTFFHLIFGELNIYQWLRFNVEHEERHTSQIRRIKNMFLIESFIAAYNVFDVDGMVSLLHDNIIFENYSNGERNVFTEGIEDFKKIAVQSVSLFKSRKQSISDITFQGDTAEVTINFEGILAVDFSESLKAGETLNLPGKSVYRFSEGKISYIADYS
ncbi:nuclear transport factor 2 family protein [Heliobacterium mobile]|uniref:nuclear transport factor 2 family protein n=1 Tax=Heliobacterium mobile TaxID=28064 RepID=UPI0012D83A62|nr:nuclear transport factor 2 family protein [Heliobacterium mobile]